MIARKQEISLQPNQLIDPLLLGRSVSILFCLAAPAALLLKERIHIAHRTMRLRRGEAGERIILGGEADNAHRILQGFSPSQRLEIHVVHIVDLEHLGTEGQIRGRNSQASTPSTSQASTAHRTLSSSMRQAWSHVQERSGVVRKTSMGRLPRLSNVGRTTEV